jgi:hypothetical protein
MTGHSGSDVRARDMSLVPGRTPPRQGPTIVFPDNDCDDEETSCYGGLLGPEGQPPPSAYF